MLTQPSKWITSFVDNRLGTAGRYLVVSAINVANHQLLLFLANSIWGWTAGWANAFAAVVAAGPAYVLSRYWVWEVSGRHSVRGEILPFWGLTLLGLVVSSGLAEAGEAIGGAGLLVNIGSLVGYFIVWVAKFAILDRLFSAAGEPASPA